MVKWQYTPFEIELFFQSLMIIHLKISRKPSMTIFIYWVELILKKTELNKIWKRKMFRICRAYIGIEK